MQWYTLHIHVLLTCSLDKATWYKVLDSIYRDDISDYEKYVNKVGVIVKYTYNLPSAYVHVYADISIIMYVICIVMYDIYIHI